MAQPSLVDKRLSDIATFACKIIGVHEGNNEFSIRNYWRRDDETGGQTEIEIGPSL